MGVLDGLTGIGNTILGFKNYEYMKDMQSEAWRREDTAVQRRAADLEAAGLSKILAAGGAAASSSPIRLDAPQISPEIGNAIPKAISTAAAVQGMMRQKKEMAQTESSTKLAEAQARKASAEADLLDATNPQKVAMGNLDLEQKTRSMESIVKSLELDVQRKGFEQSLQALNKRLVTEKVTQAEWQNTLNQLRKEGLVQGMDRIKQEMTAKEITMELLRANRDLSQHNLNWYKEVGLPSNQALGPVTLSEWLRRQSQKAYEKVNAEKKAAEDAKKQPEPKASTKVLKG